MNQRIAIVYDFAQGFLFLSFSASVADAEEYGKSDRAMMRHLPEDEREKIQEQVRSSQMSLFSFFCGAGDNCITFW